LTAARSLAGTSPGWIAAMLVAGCSSSSHPTSSSTTGSTSGSSSGATSSSGRGSTTTSGSTGSITSSSTSSTSGSTFQPAGHLTLPALSPWDGRTTSPMTLVTITASNDDLAPTLQAFSDALVQSQWFQTVGAPYGLQLAAASLHVTGTPAINTSLTDAQIVGYIQAVIADGGPSPNGSTISRKPARWFGLK